MRGSTSINGNNTAGAHLVAGGGGGHNSNHSGGVPEVLRGLKVRMGVASGFAPADTHICRCALMQLAKGTRVYVCVVRCGVGQPVVRG